jgi:hypothetical protein
MRPADTRRRSVYEDRDPIALASDPDEPEAGWRRIGKLDPRSGVWGRRSALAPPAATVVVGGPMTGAPGACAGVARTQCGEGSEL